MSESRPYILFAEDDKNLGNLLSEFLRSSGFEVDLFRDGQAAMDGFAGKKYDICLIDVMLPRVDGFSLASFIKKENPDIPMLILSARSMKEDKIKGFRVGVDDYVTKPFDEEELVYRINAILARTKTGKGTNINEKVFIGMFCLDEVNQSLTIDSTVQRLTVKEARILGMLARSSGNIVKREDVMNEIWGDSGYYTGRSLDVFISKLRSYLKNDPSLRITTIPTVGYILEYKK